VSGAHHEPTFDPKWLDLLPPCLETNNLDGVVVEDLYLERRLEIRLHRRTGSSWVEECRSNGTAVRRRTPGRFEIEATTGTTPRAVARLLGDGPRTRTLSLSRPLPQPELDLPRGWRDRVEHLCTRTTLPNLTARVLARRATVVRSEGWQAVEAPVLIRLESSTASAATLLSTWEHPELDLWATRLHEPVPRRRWRPSSGERVVTVFTEGTGGVLLHELIGHLLESDLLIRGSALTDIENRDVAPPTLTVVDDPTRFDLPGAFTADDEGVPARPMPLVEAGRIVGSLCDRAGAFVLDAKPGRGRRSTWSSAPVARMSNLVISPGSEAPGGLEAEVRKGLAVTRLAGATVDPASGRVIVRVDGGWELRYGRRRRVLAPIELTGTVLDVLAGIDPALGADQVPDWRLGWCLKDGLPLPTGSSAPTMVVRALEVL
jgi:hypothetical protein